MTQKTKRLLTQTLHFVICSLIAILMAYPLLWMIGASFKENAEIYNNANIFPKDAWVTTAFADGWRGVGELNFGVFMKNSVQIVLMVIPLTLISSTLTAYGFARFRFVGKQVYFMLMLSTLMLPNAVIQVPTYILFRDLGWLNSYLPMVVPSAFAANSFLVFMLVQFFRNLPRDLDEAARIDGCNSMMILIRILVPLCVPAMVSTGLFQFMWTWNDYFRPLLYLNSGKLYTVALGLRMSLDTTSGVQWNQIMAMSTLSVLPCIILFFCLQKYFVEGIATSGMKA